MSKARDLADSVSTGGILEDGAVSVSEISDLTATAAELNTLDGITASTADLNNVAGINSDVQTQLDLKAPLASPTFTGDATFDTNTLAVDSTNNRVGIGTTSPSVPLEVIHGSTSVGLLTRGSFNYQAKFESTDAEAAIVIEDSNSTNDGNRIGVITDDMTFITADSERMRINSSGNVGIGTSSSFGKMTINSNGAPASSGNMSTGLTISNGSVGTAINIGTNDAGAYNYIQSGYVNNADSARNLVFFSGASEAFRFGTSGELGIGGATYGTAGQVLTSGGSGAAPTWADAAGGGTAEFTTSANVTAGDAVVLNANGTVGPVTITSALSGSYNDSQVQSGTVYQQDIAYDVPSGYTVAAYNRDDTSDRYYGKTFNYNPATNQWGFTEFIVSTNVTNYNHMAYDPVEGTCVFIWSEGGNGYYRTGQVQSDGSMNLSTTTAFTGGLSTIQTQEMYSVYDPDSGKIIIVWKKNETVQNETAYMVGTVSGNSVSWGSEGLVTNDNINSGSYPPAGALTYDESQNRVLFVFMNDSQTDKTYGIAGSVSGTTVTWGTLTEIDGQSNYGISVQYDPVSNKNLLVYMDGTTTLRYRVLTLSGSTISVGTEGTFGSFQGRESQSVYNKATQELNILISDRLSSSSGSRIVSGTISGTTFTTTVNDGWSGGSAQNITLAYDEADSDLYATITKSTSGDNIYVVRWGTITSDSDNFLGLAAETISSGSAGKITLLGGVNENQTGLTVNSRYYLSVGSDLVTSDTGTVVGRAISSTKVLVTGGQ